MYKYCTSTVQVLLDASTLNVLYIVLYTNAQVLYSLHFWYTQFCHKYLDKSYFKSTAKYGA